MDSSLEFSLFLRWVLACISLFAGYASTRPMFITSIIRIFVLHWSSWGWDSFASAARFSALLVGASLESASLPLLFGFGTMIYIPDGTPHVQKCLIDDSNYVGSVQPFFRAWYESHHSFPKDKTEFLDALRTGPAAWQYRVSAPPTLSDYSKRGVRLPYEVIVVQNASGPQTDHFSERPGVIYYWIANDQQRFWVTMTELTEDVSRSASLKMLSLPRPNPYVIAVDSGDYPIRR